jgi:transposase
MQLTIDSPSVLICTRPVDFRKSIDGLVAVVESEWDSDPRSSIFVFHNRARDRVKILAWHKNGFVLLLKRLERGQFFGTSSEGDLVSMTPQQLGWLIAGLDWVTMSKWGELEFGDFR